MFGFETSLCSATFTVEQPMNSKANAAAAIPIRIRWGGVPGAGFGFMEMPMTMSQDPPLRIDTVKTGQQVKYSREQRKPIHLNVFRPGRE